MSDDQTLMDGMPASREFVLPEERKMYRGFQMPVFKTTEQEMRYKAAIDERDNFRSKAARQLPRQVEDYIKEPLRGVGRSAKEVGKEMFKEAAPLPGMAKGVGEFAVDAALTVPRAKAAMYTDPEGSKEFMGAVASGDREAVRKFATGASESMVEPFATGGDAVLSLDALERGDSVEAGMYGAAVLAPYISLGMLKAAQRGGSKAAQDAAQKITDLEAGLDAGSINSIQAKEVGDAITAEYKKAAEFADMLKAAQRGGSKAARDAAQKMDDLEAGLDAGSINSIQAKEVEDAITAEYKAAEFADMLKAAQRGGSKAARDAAQKMDDLEAGLDAGSINSIQAKEVEDAITAEYKAAEFAEQTRKSQQQSYDIIAKAREKAPGGKPPGGSDPEDLMMQRQQDYYEGITTDMRGTPRVEPPSRDIPTALTERQIQRIDRKAIVAEKNALRRKSHDVDSDYSEADRARSKELSRALATGNPPPGGGGGVASFKTNEAAKQEYFRSKGLGVYEPELSSPKFGLSNQGHHNVVEDLGPLLPDDRYLLERSAGKYGLNESEMRQLRDEYVAYGYDDFPGRSARGFEEIDIPDQLPIPPLKPVKQKYYLLDPRTDKPIRTKSGKLKEFNSPDEADEYADEVLDDMTLGIRDLDGNIPDGWR